MRFYIAAFLLLGAVWHSIPATFVGPLIVGGLLHFSTDFLVFGPAGQFHDVDAFESLPQIGCLQSLYR